jgi:diguanylate cyclase (GGDEF)-like protein
MLKLHARALSSAALLLLSLAVPASAAAAAPGRAGAGPPELLISHVKQPKGPKGVPADNSAPGAKRPTAPKDVRADKPAPDTKRPKGPKDVRADKPAPDTKRPKGPKDVRADILVPGAKGNGGGGVDLREVVAPVVDRDPGVPPVSVPTAGGEQGTASPAAPEPAASIPVPPSAPSAGDKAAAERSPTHARRAQVQARTAAVTQRGPSKPVTDGAAKPAAHVRSGTSKGSRAHKASADRSVPGSLVRVVVEQIPPEYRVALVGLATISLLLAGLTLRERRRSLRVQLQAMVDGLTGLPNRQAFESRLAKEWGRSERYDRNLGLLLLDLDDFKEINDTRGHVHGDRVLQQAAGSIARRIRETDMAARLGGDEFVVLCPETDVKGLEVLSHALEQRLRDEASIQMSVGFTQRAKSDLGPADMVTRADAEMYRRKQVRRAEHKRKTTATASETRVAAVSAD